MSESVGYRPSYVPAPLYPHPEPQPLPQSHQQHQPQPQPQPQPQHQHQQAYAQASQPHPQQGSGYPQPASVSAPEGTRSYSHSQREWAGLRIVQDVSGMEGGESDANPSHWSIHAPGLSPTQHAVSAASFLRQYEDEGEGEAAGEEGISTDASMWHKGYTPKPIAPRRSSTHSVTHAVTLEEVAAARGLTPSTVTGLGEESRHSTTPLTSHLQALIDRKRELVGSFKSAGYTQPQAYAHA